ncbi:MAG: PIG-L family deacetylase [Acidimicrobiales bacterium]|nr:PIG-L family deacetylase [Acidimicrobiales bacterium]
MTRAVVVAPHPDDEVLGCSSVLLGGDVAVVHVTEGVPPWTPAAEKDELAATRQAECTRAWEVLSGDVERVGLGFGDLVAWRSVEDVAEAMVGAIAPFGDAAVYLPAYQRGHPDHDATFLAGALARDRLDPARRSFHVYGLYGFDQAGRVRFGWLPPEVYGTVEERGARALLEAKAQALRRFTSQVWPDSALDLWLQRPVGEHLARWPDDWARLPEALTAAGVGWYYDEELGFSRHGASAAEVEAAFGPVLAAASRQA